MLTKSQLNKLGDRLGAGRATPEDLVALEQFRKSFASASEHVVSRITKELEIVPSVRMAKTTESIANKINREKTRLSTMQDIAGCRIVVEGIAEQDRVADRLAAIFPEARMYDRRTRPSHGYRAVHVVVSIDGLPVEVQIRTQLQHQWAEICEKLADFDPAVKYGGGDTRSKDVLQIFSAIFVLLEQAEQEPGSHSDKSRELLQSIRLHLVSLLDSLVVMIGNRTT